MPLYLTRSVMAVVFAAAFSLVCLSGCKKKPKPTEPDAPPTQNPNPTPNPGGNTSNRDPMAPRSPVFSSTTEAPMRLAAENNLKVILLGLHNFHDTQQSLPGGYADKNGKPGLSWRVALLPFIEQEGLFKQFKLDEPWDSENNKKLIDKMPAVYAPPRTPTNGYTFYRGFTGPNTWLPPQQQPARSGELLRGVRLTNITDGTSNTFLVAEAYDPVIWTKPDELVFAPNSVPRLGGVFQSGFVVGFADGSVRFLPNSVSQKTLANAIQINDGNIVDFDN
jgi:hypothetical protein